MIMAGLLISAINSLYSGFAVAGLPHAGKRRAEVAATFGVTRQAVAHWCRAWGGPAAARRSRPVASDRRWASGAPGEGGEGLA